jgi:bacillolysin/thermolysin
MQKKNNSSIVIIIIVVFLIFLFILFTTFGKSDKGGQGNSVSDIILQQTAVQQLANESRKSVDYYAENGVMRHLNFEWTGQAGQSPQEVLSDFLKEYVDLFNINDIDQQLRLVETSQTSDGGTTLQYNQIYNGIPVYGAELMFHISASGVLDWYEGVYISNLSMDTSGSISEKQAFETIKEYLGEDQLDIINSPELLIYNPKGVGLQESDDLLLVWYFKIASETTLNGFFVDAKKDIVINTLPLLDSGFSYQIYDVEEKWWKFWSKNATPKLIVENDIYKVDDSQIDNEAKNLSSHLSTIYDYYKSNFEWQSYDGKDSPIKTYINFKIKLFIGISNAWWNRDEKAIYFTDGLADYIDIPAHEFTHGVTNSLGGFDVLIPNTVSESMALSESFSDIFAAYIDNNQPWEICYTDCSSSEDIIRDLENPLNSEDPSHTKNLVKPGDKKCTSESEIEYGCGHSNSTIHSHAVYLFTQKIGEEKSSHIVFNALRSRMIHSYADFSTARRVIVGTCREMIGQYDIQEQDCVAIEEAYESVGIKDESITVEPKKEEKPGSVITVIAPMPEATAFPQSTSLGSEVVLVMDISGSMEKDDISGITKIEAAQHASTGLLDVISTEQEAFNGSVNHSVGLVTFSTSADTRISLTTSIEEVQNTILNLSPDGKTAMADGLQQGINQFAENNTSKQMIVLLSDGMPNVSSTGWYFSRDEYQAEVVDLATTAGEKGICIYTIGFGNPSADEESEGFIDEAFLREVASASKCGSYYLAQDAGQLADVFVELRHASMGSILFQQSGTINQSENIDLGTFAVSGNQSQMLFTLNWPGSLLTANLVDPSGKTVDDSYQGATISSQDTITSIVITSPQAGNWHLQIYGQDVPEGVTSYNTVVSTRGGTANESDITWLWFVLGGAVVVIALVAIKKPQQRNTLRNSRAQGPRLVLISGSMAGKQIRLAADMLIGRNENCQIIIPDPSVSRKHARICFANNAWFIQDQNSSSGTFVNKEKIHSIRLHSGDLIRLGNTEMNFYDR